MDTDHSIGCNDEHQMVLPARRAHTTATLLRAMVCLKRFKKQRGRREMKKKQQRKTERQERKK
jgi:hypothetical protein